MDSRLTSLEETVVDLALKVSTLERVIPVVPNAVSYTLGTIDRRIQRLESYVGSVFVDPGLNPATLHDSPTVDRLIQDMVAGNQEVDDRMEEMDEEMMEMDRKMMRLGRKMVETDKKMVVIDKKMRAIDEDMEDTEERMDHVQDEAKALACCSEAQTRRSQADMNIMQEEIKHIIQRTDTDMRSMEQRIVQVNQRMDTTASQAQTAKTQAETATTQAQTATTQAENLTKHHTLVTDMLNRQTNTIGFMATQNLNARESIEELKEEVERQGVRLQRLTNDPQPIVLPRDASRITRHNMMHRGINRELRAGVNRMLRDGVRRRRMTLRFRTPNIPYL